jgi:phosphoglycerol transferase MdoB-like AlkP superfamily enzyme
MSDKDLFKKTFAVLDSLAQMQKPFFSTVVTLSNHHPYKMPHDFQIFDSIVSAQTAPYLNGLHYTDHCLGLFIDSLITREWFTNTYLMITADNGNKPIIANINIPQEVEYFYHVPFVLIGPKIEAGSIDTIMASHFDVCPTILDLAGCDRTMGLGNSLLAGERRTWAPNVATFFGDIVLRPGSFIMKYPNNTIQSWGTPLEQDSLLLEHLSRYQKLWTRLIQNGQSDLLGL